jgi:hypothetical protein
MTSRTGSRAYSVSKNKVIFNYTSSASSSISNNLLLNAVNLNGTASFPSQNNVAYASVGAGLSNDETRTYYDLVSTLQYGLGRGLLIEGYPAAAAYSVRRISKTTQYAMQVRRDFDDVTFDVGFDSLGNLNTGSLLTNMTASGVSTALPGSYSGLAAAYSLRKVSSTYTGSAIDVRRDSDNITGSIGFDSFGNLDTGSLLAFVTGSANTGSGYVTQWYDQSGNARHATQTTTGSQPLIVSSGSLITSSFARPSVKFDGVDDYLDTATITVTSQSIFSVQQNISGKDVDVIFGSTGNNYYSNNINTQLVATNTAAQDQFTGAYSTTSSITSYHRDGIGTASGSAYLNGRKLVQTGTGITTQSADYSDLGGFGNYTFQGFISEFLLYNTYKADVRGLIEDNIYSYYNITRTPYTLASGSGYVTTWYDQSGNNRHALQTLIAKQPLILRSGSVLLENNKPAIHFTSATGNSQGLDAGNIATVNSNYNFFIVKTPKGGGNPWLLIGGGWYYNEHQAGRTAVDLGYVIAASPFFGRQMLSETYYSTNTQYYENNTLRGSGYSYTPKTLTGLQIGYAGSQQYSGSLQEVIISTTNHLPNRSDITSNINSYFNIY